MRRSVLLLALAACATAPRPPAEPAPRGGGEVFVACGARLPAGTRVVLWDAPGGMDAYGGGGGHFGRRRTLRGDGLDDLRAVVTQVVVHYDAAGTSARCFEVLQKRKLSCHFLLDRDGTVYQTLDLKERAWHAGEANDRSVGVEIANLGACPDRKALPAGARVVHAPLRGTLLWQEEFTEAQYAALGRLCDALCRAFPQVRRTVPEGPDVLADPAAFRGVVGHQHLTAAKVDPGPAFDWERLQAALAPAPTSTRRRRAPPRRRGGRSPCRTAG